MGKKLYVGNLSYGVSDSDLEQLFAPHGTVQSAQVIMDRDTGRSKGFGFVEMGSDQEAQAAITAMNGAEVEGRPLTVNEARPKPEGGGGRGPGGGGPPGGGLGPGGLSGGGGRPPMMDQQASRRYSLNFTVMGRNIFNNVNLAAPVGVLESPLFGKSNALAGGFFSSPSSNRSVDLQVSFNF